MSRKLYTPDFIHRAADLINEGMTLAEAAVAMNCSADVLSVKMREIGLIYERPYRPAPNAKPFDEAECIARYRAGESVKALAEAYGIQRATVTAMLIRRGEPARGRSDAMFVRMANTSEADRKQLAQAAHDAVRGKPKSEQHIEKIVASRFARQTHIGCGEKDLASQLRSLGVDVITQAPVKSYNVDLLCLGRVAVEVHSSSRLPGQDAYFSKRTKDLLDCGLVPLYLTGQHCAHMWPTIAEELVAHINELCRLPAGARQYRMIRGALHNFTTIRNDLGQFTCVPSAPRFGREVRDLDL
jgi:very-short-patch-repair endonuclease